MIVFHLMASMTYQKGREPRCRLREDREMRPGSRVNRRAFSDTGRGDRDPPREILMLTVRIK